MPKEWIKVSTTTTIEKLHAESYNLLLNPMRAKEVTWTQQARVLCRKWAVRHPKDHFSMLKKDGYKQGTKRSPNATDWNADLVELREELFDKAFKDLSTVFDKYEEDFRKSFGSILERTRAKIRSEITLFRSILLAVLRLIYMQMIPSSTSWLSHPS